MTQPINFSAASPESKIKKKFVAINYISCKEKYKPRFEKLFASRAHAIDRIPGFIKMEVLKPTKEGEYLIVSHWESKQVFKSWTKSPEFLEGHQRGFKDLQQAKKKGEEPPMTSDFKTYEIIAR